MKTKTVFLSCLLFCLYATLTKAQETRLKDWGVETGMTFVGSEISDMDFVRGDVPSYEYGYSSSSLSNLYYKSFIGVKAEVFSLNDRFSGAGGLRF